MSRIIKIIPLILLILIVSFDIMSARGGRGSGGGGGSSFSSHSFSAGIKNIRTSDIRSYATHDTSQCAGTGSSSAQKDQYICDAATRLSFSMKEGIIGEKKSDIESTYLNQYDRGSVNYYNKKIAEYNALIEDYNGMLKQECMSQYEYCLPYSCHQRFPGTAYSKIQDQCLCENGQEFDKISADLSGDGCKSVPNKGSGGIVANDRENPTSHNQEKEESSWWPWILSALFGFWVIKKILRSS